MSPNIPVQPSIAAVFLRIGLLSFGGPAAQIALMQSELVDRYKWISQDDFLKVLSFCMLLPGPEAMQLATYIGWQRAGVWGGLIAGALFVIPGAVVVAVMALTYVTYGHVSLVAGAFYGIQAVVVLIVAQALWRLCGRAFPQKAHIAIAIVAFGALFAYGVPFPMVILCAMAVGALIGAQGGTGRRPPLQHVGWPAVWVATAWGLPLLIIILWAPAFYRDLAVFFSTLAVVSFGGAYAVLTYLTQTVVQDHGWVTTAQMIDALGLAETTPGPLILVTQFVGMIAGHTVGGWVTALWAGVITLWMTFLPCFLWVFALGPYLDRLTAHPRLMGALSGVTAAVVGVMATLSIWFGLHVYFDTVWQWHILGAIVPQPHWASVDMGVVGITVLFAVPVLTGRIPLPWIITAAACAGAILQSVA
ncbi:MAG: chromate efflux transporter [Pseudomonadota bacterium]